jgi:GMP synthase-like glutamine amidotransferase
MILVVYFDAFHKDLEKRMGEHNIPFTLVKYTDLEQYKPDKPITKLIITGSKQRILRKNDFPLLDAYMKQDIKIIGICFGFQLLAYKTGGKVVERPLFRGTRSTDKTASPIESLYFNHYDRVIELPDTWTVVQRIDGFINVAATDKWIGFQFHPEKYDATFRHYLLPFMDFP